MRSLPGTRAVSRRRLQLLRALVNWHKAEHGAEKVDKRRKVSQLEGVGLPILDTGTYEFRSNPFKAGGDDMADVLGAWPREYDRFKSGAWPREYDRFKSGAWPREFNKFKAGAWPREFNKFKAGQTWDPYSDATFASGDDASFAMGRRGWGRFRKNWMRARIKQKRGALKLFRMLRQRNPKARALFAKLVSKARRGHPASKQAVRDIARAAKCPPRGRAARARKRVGPFWRGMKGADELHSDGLSIMEQLAGQ